MPVFQLDNELVFPHPALAGPDGLLAVGGDLTTGRLLLAYANGIFPWFEEGEPILWWSLDPRLVLFPEKLKISKSLKQTIRNKKFTVTFDAHFEEVIEACSKVERPGQEGTWIGGEMKRAYIRLHKEGYAHSVEVFKDGQLSGGLYGISLGRAFFGESMFHIERDASKVALFHLTERLIKWDFMLIDAQQDTPHLRRMGAETIPRQQFLEILKQSLQYPTVKGNWSETEIIFTNHIKTE